MKARKFISRFSPNRTAAEDLERIHVQRHSLLEEIVDLVRDSALTKNKHHLLFVGTRGCGKTHLLSLINHRLGKQIDLANRLRIAWLNEDETSTSFLDLLVRIYQALSELYPTEFPCKELEELFGGEPTQARAVLEKALVRCAGKHTVLVMIENLDGLFRQLSEADQRSWRSFIQNHPVFATLATAQSLFAGVSEHDQPFFGFFDTRHLKPLSVEEAIELLQKIAILNEDTELESLLKTSRGRARIRAIHHLSHGNHRLYVVLSELITAESLDQLVKPFEAMVDEQLTPYYQERLRWLSPLQRKIVELLCQRGQPLPVKDIADRLFAPHSTVTPQLKVLREMGYVVSTPRGRESLYELAEPLMRLSMQVKDTPQAEPLAVIVDFLRVWYERDELEDRLACTEPTERCRAYLQAALAKLQSEPNLRHELLRAEFEDVDIEHCNADQVEQMRVLAEETNSPSDWFKCGVASGYRREHGMAVEAFTKAMKGAQSPLLAAALFNRALSYSQLDREEEAIVDFSAFIGLPNAPVRMFAWALANRSMVRWKTDQAAAATDAAKILEISEAMPGQVVPDLVAGALVVKAMWAVKCGRAADAVHDYMRAANLPGTSAPLVGAAREMLALFLLSLDRWEAAMVEIANVLEDKDQDLVSGTVDIMILSISRHIGSPQVWQARVKEVVELFAAHNALIYLGDALVRHLANLATSPISGDGFKQWFAIWETAAGGHEAMRLPLRLLRVGIDYLATQPRNAGILLQLPAEERLLLRQALSLPE